MAKTTKNLPNTMTETEFGIFPKEILVFYNGFVFIGDHDEANHMVYNCLNLRTWGITAGIGELAVKGPTDQTVTEAYGVMRYCVSDRMNPLIARFPIKHKKFDYVSPNKFGDQHIVIAERSWVFAGNLIDKDGNAKNYNDNFTKEDKVRLTHAAFIRRFGGSDQGIGILSTKGPVKETEFDPCGDVIMPLCNALFIVPCVNKLF